MRSLNVFLACWLWGSTLWGAPPGDATPRAGDLLERVTLGRVGEPILTLPPLDLENLRRLDEQRLAAGRAAHFAAPWPVAVDPWHQGQWSLRPDGLLEWQLRFDSPGALSLAVAFERLRLPPGAWLDLRTGDGRQWLPTLRAAALEADGKWWSAPLDDDELQLTLVIPAPALGELELSLTQVFQGYAGLGAKAGDRSGACQLDPGCGDGEDWRNEARAVALLTIEGTRFCTGFLVNNTALDGRPWLLTAGHCGIQNANAASLVAIWGYERRGCEGPPPTGERWSQNGARFQARQAASDMVLLELSRPPAAAWQVSFAGWDRSEDPPSRGATVHHPNGDSKRLAVTGEARLDGPITRSSYLGEESDPQGFFWRVPSWRGGTTEGGSSGAPLFDQNRRAVGWLRGGFASCADPRADFFGRLASAWDGPSPKQRLRDWLDPLGLGLLRLDALDPRQP